MLQSFLNQGLVQCCHNKFEKLLSYIEEVCAYYDLFTGTLIIGAVLAVLWCVNGNSSRNLNDPCDSTSWDLENKNLKITALKASPRVVNSTLVEWGLTIPGGVEGVPCSDGDQCFDYGIAKVVITYIGNCQKVAWTSANLTELKDCVNLLGHWYGGGAQNTEPWPMEINPRNDAPFVTADTIGNPTNYGGVSERYWISSIGVAAKVEDDVPLFLSLPDNNVDGTADQMCFSSRYENPFVASPSDPTLHLTYNLCSSDDVRQVYESSFSMFYALPRDIPDEKMFKDPIWSTWAQYKGRVNDTKVLTLAEMINSYGFDNSQIEIDDNWETCYGDQIFNPAKFPDPKGMVDQLHAIGFRVTLWIHPFINRDCQSFSTVDQNGFFIKDSNGTTQLTAWWNGLKAGIIDFTNTNAALWWTLRLQNLRLETGIDSFKFDAGETSWLPKIYTLELPTNYWPNGYTSMYVDTVTDFGNLIEVRVGHSSQQQPIFVRMLDKDSRWGYENGLATMIPSLLHHSLIGYPFVLPDMIGGNAYSGRPDAELFIRWAQANTFMPSMQFSLLPWDFGIDSDLVVNISKDVTALHASFAPLLIELARNSTLGMGPIIRPTWWLCPNNEDCLVADQQFLVGDDILAAPIVIQGATSVDVVFPLGGWAYLGAGPIYDGPSKQTITGLDIYSNVYFTRV